MKESFQPERRKRMRIDLSTFDRFQKDSILENSGRDIVVGASAGAGKTLVLVTRILKRCIEDRIPVDRILALTFTAAAAEEMKNRLSSALHSLHEETDDPADRKYISDQITLLANASITTIDSYCLTLIRRWCSTIGLDPATAENVLSEGKNEAFRQQAFRNSLSRLAAEDHDGVFEMLEYFSKRPEDYSTLFTIVRALNLHVASAVDPVKWYEECRTSYIPFTSFRQLPEGIRKPWFDYLTASCVSILHSAQKIRERLVESPEKKLKEEMVIPVINLASHCLSYLEEEDYDAFRELFKELACVKVTRAADEVTETYRKAMFKEIDSLLAVCYPAASYAKNSALQSRVVNTLVRLAQYTADEFTRLKKNESAMDFSDMERYALEILNANSRRAAILLNQSYDEIMIDEFQDTSILQDTIITLISRAQRHVPVFRVGDVKQSIYRFRQAKPQLMRDLMGSSETKVFNMRYNYRSHEGIIDFTNLLFDRLMNIQGIKDVYTKEDHVQAGNDSQKVLLDEPPVCLTLLSQPDPESENDKSSRLNAKEKKDFKASYIAWKITEMIRESKGKLRYSDFAVLTRSHDDQIVLRSYFDRYGIPYDLDAREGFYRSDLCQDILSICRYLRNPDDLLALTATATSGLFSLSDEQLARAAVSAGNLRKGIEEEYPQIRELAEKLRECAHSQGIIAFLNMLALTPVYSVALDREILYYDSLSAQSQANFDCLTDLCINAGINDLSQLIHEIENGEAEGSSEAVTTGMDDEVVTVTTIHHSKGLQYNIVFLWGTGSSKFSDSREAVLIDDELKLGIRDVDLDTRIVLPTIQRIVISEKLNMEDIEEYTRLLYVAVTRAKNQLIIVDMDDSETDCCDPSREILKARKGMTGLITSVLSHDEEINENNLLKVSRFSADTLPEVFADTPAYSGKNRPSSLVRLKIQPRILPQIKTPSQLEKSRTAEGEAAFVLPLFSPESAGGSNYGTLMHKACEDLPDDQEWTKELIRSVADASLPDKAIEDLYAFGHSDLYKSCLNMDIHKEYPFYFENENSRINGTIDFAAVGENDIVIIDFKTDRKTPEEILEEYAPQLNTYRAAMAHFYPEHNIRVYAWSFHNGTEIEVL